LKPAYNEAELGRYGDALIQSTQDLTRALGSVQALGGKRFDTT